MKQIMISVIGSVGMSICALGLPVTASLKFHVDASIEASVTTDGDGYVSKWADLTDSGLDVSQGSVSLRPLYHDTAFGKALYFDGSDWMNSAKDGICYANHTIFIVAKPDRGYSTTHEIGDLFGSCRNSDYTANKDILMMCNWDSGRMFRAAIYGSGGNRYVCATKPNSTDLVIFDQAYDSSSQELSARVNNAFETTSTFTDFAPTAERGVILGGRSAANFDGLRFHGDMYEILVYDRALTAQERRAVADHLGAKWKVPAFVPGDEVAVTDGLRFRLDAKMPGLFTTNSTGAITTYIDSYCDDRITLADGGYAPTYVENDGERSVHFAGNQWLVSKTAPIDYANHNIFIVCKPSKATGANCMGDLFLSNTGGGYTDGDVMLMCNWDASSVMRAGIWRGSSNYTCLSSKAQTTDKVIIEARYDGTTLTPYVNGSYTAGTVTVPSFSKLGGVNLGGRPNYGRTNFTLFSGEMYEVLVYDRALTEAERMRVLKQLYERWNVVDDYKATVDSKVAQDETRRKYRAQLPVTDGLRAWVAADAAAMITTNDTGFVTSWASLSENEFSLAPVSVGKCPTMTTGFLDRPWMRFDNSTGNGGTSNGGKVGMAGGSVCYSNHTVFVVAMPATSPACGEDLFGSISTANGYDGAALMLVNKNSKAMRAAYFFTANASSSFNVNEYSFTTAASTNPAIYEQRMSDTAMDGVYWSRTGGREAHTVANSTARIGSAKRVALGGRAENGYAANCSYAEVLVYDRALTDGEVSQIETYLRDKWFGVAFDLEVKDHALAGVTLVDTTELTSGGTITIAGSTSTLPLGVYPLVTGDGIRAGQNWTVNFTDMSDARVLTTTVKDGVVSLNISKRGLVVIFK